MPYRTQVGEELNAKREALQTLMDALEKADEGEVSERRDALDAAVAEIGELERTYQALSQAEQQNEVEAVAVDGLERSSAGGAAGDEITYERVNRDGASIQRANIPPGVSYARAYMGSPGFKLDPKHAAEVELPGLLHRALGAAEGELTAGYETLMRALTSSADFETVRPFIDVVSAPSGSESILNNVPRIPVDRLKFDWSLQTTATNAASTPAEGAAAAESTIVWTKQAVTLKRVRTILPVTDDVLTSEPLLNSLLQTDLAQFIRAKTSSQIAVGTGASNQLSGFGLSRTNLDNLTVNIGTPGTNKDAAGNIIDAVSEAITKITNNEGAPTAVWIKPEAFQVLRDARTQITAAIPGPYLYQHPADAAPPRIHGVPVVMARELPTYAATSRIAIVGDFARFSRLFTMGDVMVQMTDSHAATFADWETMMRAGIWAEFSVTRDEAFVTLTRAT